MFPMLVIVLTPFRAFSETMSFRWQSKSYTPYTIAATALLVTFILKLIFLRQEFSVFVTDGLLIVLTFKLRKSAPCWYLPHAVYSLYECARILLFVVWKRRSVLSVVLFTLWGFAAFCAGILSLISHQIVSPSDRDMLGNLDHLFGETASGGERATFRRGSRDSLDPFSGMSHQVKDEFWRESVFAPKYGSVERQPNKIQDPLP